METAADAASVLFRNKFQSHFRYSQIRIAVEGLLEYIWFVVDCVYTRRLIRLIVADLGVHFRVPSGDSSLRRTRAIEAHQPLGPVVPFPECLLKRPGREKEERPGLGDESLSFPSNSLSPSLRLCFVLGSFRA